MNVVNINSSLTDVKSVLVCKIELTLEETKAILDSLGQTMCSGKELTISMELEDKLVDVLKNIKI